MKPFLVLLLLITSIWGHTSHGVEDITKTSSLLWLKSELNLSTGTYRGVVAVISRYRNKGFESAMDDVLISIAKEQLDPKPDSLRIKSFQSRYVSLSEKKIAAFSDHIVEIRSLLTKEEFVQYTTLFDKIYQLNSEERKAHGHEHSHGNGVRHSHKHLHDVDAVTGAQPYNSKDPHQHSH